MSDYQFYARAGCVEHDHNRPSITIKAAPYSREFAVTEHLVVTLPARALAELPHLIGGDAPAWLKITIESFPNNSHPWTDE